jgi:uncharacterized RDD family membrane protein YckC
MSSYGYPGSNESGGYSYPTDSGGYHQGYPVSPQTSGSLQPQDLSWRMDQRGKIGRSNASGGGYYNCANWLWRVLAGLIDYGPLALLYYVATNLSVNFVNRIGVDLANLLSNLMLLLMLLLGALNIVVLQGLTAQSIGKKVLGLQLVRGVTTDGQDQWLVRPGVPWALIRMVAHILDAVPCYIGFFAPLWTRKRQTFADMVANTAVIRERSPIGLSFAPPGSRAWRL